MKPKPVVGQTLYSLNVGNAARHRDHVLTPVVVRKVGRKYFSCSPSDSDWAVTWYYLEDWTEKTEYTPDSRLFESEQEWIELREKSEILDLLREVFSNYHLNLSLEDLRAIKSICTKA